MKKITKPLLSAILAVFILVFSSCKEEARKNATVSFETTSQTVGEDGVDILIPYQIQDGPIAGDAVIEFNFSGTATQDVDYVFTGWNNDGVSISLVDDSDLESSETIIVSMSNGTGVVISQPDEHTVTIEDNDAAILGFQTPSGTVNESEGSFSTIINLTPLVGTDPINISVGIAGTAAVDIDYDLSIDGSGSDLLLIFSNIDDDISEVPETAIITLTSVDDGPAVLSGNVSELTFTLTIEDNEPAADTDLKIDLTWDAGGGTPGDVDMDLILWKHDPGLDVFNFVDGAFSIGTTFESLTLSGTEDDAMYGLTYQYFEGSSNNLEFTVTFTTTDGTLEGTENELSFSETYTLSNINSSTTVFIEQIFDKLGSDYNSFSAIEVPGTGSRMKSFSIPSIKKQRGLSTKR